MPQNPRKVRRRGQNRRRQRRSRNGSSTFSSPQANGIARGSPTSDRSDPYQTALLRTPLFAATVRQRGQLYYDKGLGLTAPVSGNTVTYFFTANGMFDPDITGTGHQPMGFDQMMTLYNQCTVYHSSIKVTFFGNGLAVRAGVALWPNATPITNPDQVVENGLIKTVAINSQGSNTAQNNMLQSVILDCDVKKYFGRPSDQSMVNDVSLATTAAANPTEQVYYAIMVWQLNPDGSTTSSIGFDVLVQYDAIYWEQKKEVES